MRHDMHRVIIEPGRRDSRARSRKWGAKVTEDYDGPTRVSSGRRQYPDLKTQSDKLGPLERFVRRQAGRPWNKVYSEICDAVPKGMHRDHVDSHLRHIVAIRCFYEDGELWGTHSGIFSRPTRIADWYTGLYVDPRTGILRDARRKKKRQHKPARPRPEVFWTDSTHQYRRIRGVWYELTHLRHDPDEILQTCVKSGFTVHTRRRHTELPLLELVGKRQLNTREVRSLEARLRVSGRSVRFCTLRP